MKTTYKSFRMHPLGSRDRRARSDSRPGPPLRRLGTRGDDDDTRWGRARIIFFDHRGRSNWGDLGRRVAGRPVLLATASSRNQDSDLNYETPRCRKQMLGCAPLLVDLRSRRLPGSDAGCRTCTRRDGHHETGEETSTRRARVPEGAVPPPEGSMPANAGTPCCGWLTGGESVGPRGRRRSISGDDDEAPHGVSLPRDVPRMLMAVRAGGCAGRSHRDPRTRTTADPGWTQVGASSCATTTG